MDSRPGSDVRVVRRWIGTRRPHDSLGLDAPGAAFSSEPGAGPAEWSGELPGTSLEVIVELDGRWDLEIDGARTTAGAFTGGLVAGAVRSRPVGAVRLVQLSVDPLDARAVFGAPAGELIAIVALDDLLGREASALLERLDGADGAIGDADASADRIIGPGAVAAAEAWVQKRVARAADGAAAPADVRRARDLIRASGGALRMQAVADELGCSRRHLARRFDEFLGVPPSAFTRLVRFERAVASLRLAPAQPLGRLAIDANYADHAHMVRDFHALAGATPSAVAARLAA